MRVYGLDFTGAPGSGHSGAIRRKRLTLAACTLDGDTLIVDELRSLNGARSGDFSGFEGWLGTGGGWIAGLDFPFGQPAELIRELGWPETWAGYVGHVGALGKAGFEKILVDYKATKPPGRKEPRRATDVAARSVSPMKLAGVPIGKMFFQGATRLLDSPLSIDPVRPVTGEGRAVVEAYPALVARKWIGKRGYKNDDPSKQSEGMRLARIDLVDAVRDRRRAGGAPSIREHYGFVVSMSDEVARESIEDPTGDGFDSILCAIQAAWAHRRSRRGREEWAPIDRLERVIADPKIMGP